MIDHHRLYLAKLMGTKPKVCRQLNRIEPELGGRVIAIHMTMGRLIRLMTIEVESIRAGSESRRHGPDCSRGSRRSRVYAWLGYVGIRGREEIRPLPEFSVACNSARSYGVILNTAPKPYAPPYFVTP